MCDVIRKERGSATAVAMGRAQDLTPLDRGMIVGARKMGHSISQVATALGFSRATVARVYQKYVNSGQTSAARKNCGRPQLMQEQDRQRLTKMVTSQQRRTLHQITSQFNDGATQPISQRTVQRTLYSMGFRSRRPTRTEHTSREQPAQQCAITGNEGQSQIIDFYKNQSPAKPYGFPIETILQEWDDDYDKLDEIEKYMEWLFPNRKPGKNPQAPLLTDEDVNEICSSPTLKERALRAFMMMLKFYGMQLEISCTITLTNNHKERLAKISSHNKYYYGIMRILQFLKEINESQLMLVWLKFLADLIKQKELDINAKRNFYEFWINTLDDFGKEEIKQYIQQINKN